VYLIGKQKIQGFEIEKKESTTKERTQ